MQARFVKTAVFLTKLTLALSIGSSSAAFSAESLSTPGRILAESDTGETFGTNNCQVLDGATTTVERLVFDSWDYLYAVVNVHYSCVTEEGRIWEYDYRDQVIFPTLTFDWRRQAWVTDGVEVAVKGQFGAAIPTDAVVMDTWSHVDADLTVAFRVSIRRALHSR